MIFNYAQEIFSKAGYSVSDILFNIVITGSVNLIFTFIGMFTVDKLGRKALMLFGAGGLAGIFAVTRNNVFFSYSGTSAFVYGSVCNCLLCYVACSGNMGSPV